MTKPETAHKLYNTACVCERRDNGWKRVYIRQQPAVSRAVDRMDRYSHWTWNDGAVPTGQRSHDIGLQTTM